jgi:hypothetical protein
MRVTTMVGLCASERIRTRLNISRPVARVDQQVEELLARYLLVARGAEAGIRMASFHYRGGEPEGAFHPREGTDAAERSYSFASGAWLARNLL